MSDSCQNEPQKTPTPFYPLTIGFLIVLIAVLLWIRRNESNRISERAATKSDSSQIDLKKIEEERMRTFEDSKDEWRAPINFFGKVVDEKKDPVAGVEVGFGWTDLSPTEGYSRAQTISDSNGLFSLQNRSGKHLSVSLTKAGYYSSTKDNTSFEYGDRYSRPNPDPNMPVVFHLRKKGKAEPLIACDFPGFAKIVQLRRDGIPAEINLAECRLVPLGAGNLRLEFWGDKIERTTKKFSWKLRVSVPGGGLIETDEEFNFEAPEKGYLPAIEFDMPASAEAWRTELKIKNFIRLPDGKYGRVEFSVLARNGVSTVGAAINPSGSRNLEPIS